jgi:hypothetical protein
VVHLILFPRCEFFQPLLGAYLVVPFPPHIKIEGVLQYMSCFAPCNFFCLFCAPIYFSTTSRILKLKAFHVPSHIFPPANLFQPLLCAYLLFHRFPDIKFESILWCISHYSPPPPANLFIASPVRLFIFSGLPGFQN